MQSGMLTLGRGRHSNMCLLKAGAANVCSMEVMVAAFSQLHSLPGDLNS